LKPCETGGETPIADSRSILKTLIRKLSANSNPNKSDTSATFSAIRVRAIRGKMRLKQTITQLLKITVRKLT
jgi:hypothetical protein